MMMAEDILLTALKRFGHKIVERVAVERCRIKHHGKINYQAHDDNGELKVEKPEDIIQKFLDSNPRKRFPDKTWKVCHPVKYEAAIKLYELGYCISDIAKHIGCTYDTLRKTFARDKIIRPKKYRQKHKILKPEATK